MSAQSGDTVNAHTPQPAVTTTCNTAHAAWSCVLFDLDGTIADSAKGITESLAATLAELGLDGPPPDELRSWVGPPPAESFRNRLGFSTAEAERARQIYRKHYERIGNEDIRPFDAIPPVLENLSRAGVPIAVATSKPEHTAIEVLDRLGLASYFTAITGASKDEVISDKSAIVGKALSRLRSAGADTSNPAMVGDRIHDVIGAAEHGIPTVLVEWGYAEPWEYRQAIATVASTEALARFLLRP